MQIDILLENWLVAQFEYSCNNGIKGGHGYTEEFSKEIEFPAYRQAGMIPWQNNSK